MIDPHTLKPGDRVSFGDTTLTINYINNHTVYWYGEHLGTHFTECFWKLGELERRVQPPAHVLGCHAFLYEGAYDVEGFTVTPATLLQFCEETVKALREPGIK